MSQLANKRRRHYRIAGIKSCLSLILYSEEVIMTKKISNKQKAQRERFAIKGFLSGTLARTQQIMKMNSLLDIERTRITFIADCAMMVLKYYNGHTAEIIKETKNV